MVKNFKAYKKYSNKNFKYYNKSHKDSQHLQKTLKLSTII